MTKMIKEHWHSTSFNERTLKRTLQIISVTFICKHFNLGTYHAVCWSKSCLTLIVDLPIAVDVGFADHFVHLFVSELFAQVCHDVPQLRCTDVAVTILREATAKLLWPADHLARHQLTNQPSVSFKLSFCKPAYLVKDSKGFPDFLFTVSVLHLSRHHGEELRKVNCTIAYTNIQKGNGRIDEEWMAALKRYTVRSKYETVTAFCDSGPHHQHPPHWSCLGVQPRWGSVPASAWQFQALWWWWCHRRPCQTVRTPPWTLGIDTSRGVGIRDEMSTERKTPPQGKRLHI